MRGTWVAVQRAITESGASSPEAAAAMREYADAQTPAEGHAAPTAVWQPTETGAWEVAA